MQQLCGEFQISRPTGYAWLRRYQAGGITGAVEKSRRLRFVAAAQKRKVY